jgi:ABC-type xylose transport system permease subunit
MFRAIVSQVEFGARCALRIMGVGMEQLYSWILLIGPGMLAWQGYTWLKTGVWTALPISKTFQYFDWPIPSTSWLGLQKMLDWAFDTPTSL